ncbi:MAG: pyridoxamine 5'-phosphate oxidase family protein [Spirochaetales bacterium]|nr:pyridoxamine 5'-phosphate oxidase family protein [Spirochaetales bacterium]
MLPEKIKSAWINKNGPIALSTVSKEGKPNTIYASCVALHESNKILIADNFFNKTKENIKNNSAGSVLFITKDEKAYQLKGKLNYFTDGEFFDNMKQWNPERLPGHGVATLSIEEIYHGADKIL